GVSPRRSRRRGTPARPREERETRSDGGCRIPENEGDARAGAADPFDSTAVAQSRAPQGIRAGHRPTFAGSAQSERAGGREADAGWDPEHARDAAGGGHGLVSQRGSRDRRDGPDGPGGVSRG